MKIYQSLFLLFLLGIICIITLYAIITRISPVTHPVIGIGSFLAAASGAFFFLVSSFLILCKIIFKNTLFPEVFFYSSLRQAFLLLCGCGTHLFLWKYEWVSLPVSLLIFLTLCMVEITFWQRTDD